MCFAERAEFELCGYFVETGSEDNDKNINALFHDYFHQGKAKMIEQIAKNNGAEHYGLVWYTQNHEKYCYLLGKEVVAPEKIPLGAQLMRIPKTRYAFEAFEAEVDIIRAWSDFFYKDIPESGYEPNYEHGLWFEYYPDGIYGKYELWSPVVKKNA